MEYVQSLGLPMSNIPESYVNRPIPKRPLQSFASAKTPMASPEVIDLLDKMFIIDHRRRITAREALAHPYFDPVRNLFPPPGVYEPTRMPSSAAAGGDDTA